jgi:hypothetical protein
MRASRGGGVRYREALFMGFIGIMALWFWIIRSETRPVLALLMSDDDWGKFSERDFVLSLLMAVWIPSLFFNGYRWLDKRLCSYRRRQPRRGPLRRWNRGPAWSLPIRLSGRGLTFLVGSLFLPLTEMYGAALRWILIPSYNDAFWEQLRRRLQGADVAGLVLQEVSDAPLLKVNCGRLPEDLDARIIHRADVQARESVKKLRVLLGSISESTSGIAVLQDVGRAQQWKEFVHNSYFDLPEVCEVIIDAIRGQRRICAVVSAAPAATNSDWHRHRGRRMAQNRILLINLLVVFVCLIPATLVWLAMVIALCLFQILPLFPSTFDESLRWWGGAG